MREGRREYESKRRGRGREPGLEGKMKSIAKRYVKRGRNYESKRKGR